MLEKVPPEQVAEESNSCVKLGLLLEAEECHLTSGQAGSCDEVWHMLCSPITCIFSKLSVCGCLQISLRFYQESDSSGTSTHFTLLLHQMSACSHFSNTE